MTSASQEPARPVVLLVDDEADIRRVLELGLQTECDVECAPSASEADLMLATRRYDVVVCDYLMPEEAGIPFLTRVRKQFPHVQRILLTGYVNPELLSRGSQIAGLAACLLKPVRAVDLIAAIKQAIPK